MANVIFRGDTRYPPKTRTRTIVSELKPGSPVIEMNMKEFAPAIGTSINYLILNNLDFIGMSLNESYKPGDSAVAYEPREIRMPFQVRAQGPETFNFGDKLSVNYGNFKKSESGDVATMIYTGAGETISADGGLIDAETILPTEVA
ncbi:Uncharacterised protein [Yersinia frederiksenii]|nr:Uncharacterised protein [Yersinia frederiksenii]